MNDFTITGSAVPTWFLWIEWAPVLFVGAAAWLIAGGLLVVKGDEVEKPNRVAQFYGYTVCLVAILVALGSLSSVMSAAFERANPLQTSSSLFGGTALTSFDAYKATYRRNEPFMPGVAARPDTASDATLHQRYDALVADQIASVHFRTTKSLTTGLIFLLVSIVLFVTHWRWLRRLNGTASTTS